MLEQYRKLYGELESDNKENTPAPPKSNTKIANGSPTENGLPYHKKSSPISVDKNDNDNNNNNNNPITIDSNDEGEDKETPFYNTTTNNSNRSSTPIDKDQSPFYGSLKGKRKNPPNTISNTPLNNNNSSSSTNKNSSKDEGTIDELLNQDHSLINLDRNEREKEKDKETVPSKLDSSQEGSLDKDDTMYNLEVDDWKSRFQSSLRKKSPNSISNNSNNNNSNNSNSDILSVGSSTMRSSPSPNSMNNIRNNNNDNPTTPLSSLAKKKMAANDIQLNSINNNSNISTSEFNTPQDMTFKRRKVSPRQDTINNSANPTLDDATDQSSTNNINLSNSTSRIISSASQTLTPNIPVNDQQDEDDHPNNYEYSVVDLEEEEAVDSSDINNQRSSSLVRKRKSNPSIPDNNAKPDSNQSKSNNNNNNKKPVIPFLIDLHQDDGIHPKDDETKRGDVQSEPNKYVLPTFYMYSLS